MKLRPLWLTFMRTAERNKGKLASQLRSNQLTGTTPVSTSPVLLGLASVGVLHLGSGFTKPLLLQRGERSEYSPVS